jgi:hypothetical protein
MAGRFLRVANYGSWYPTAPSRATPEAPHVPHVPHATSSGGGGGGGVELMVVSPPWPKAGSNVSTVLLRLTITNVPAAAATSTATTTTTTTYTRVVISANGTKLVSTDELGSDGSLYYQALVQQKRRWDPMMARGAAPQLPRL